MASSSSAFRSSSSSRRSAAPMEARPVREQDIDLVGAVPVQREQDGERGVEPSVRHQRACALHRRVGGQVGVGGGGEREAEEAGDDQRAKRCVHGRDVKPFGSRGSRVGQGGPVDLGRDAPRVRPRLRLGRSMLREQGTAANAVQFFSPPRTASDATRRWQVNCLSSGCNPQSCAGGCRSSGTSGGDRGRGVQITLIDNCNDGDNAAFRIVQYGSLSGPNTVSASSHASRAWPGGTRAHVTTGLGRTVSERLACDSCELPGAFRDHSTEPAPSRTA